MSTITLTEDQAAALEDGGPLTLVLPDGCRVAYAAAGESIPEHAATAAAERMRKFDAGETTPASTAEMWAQVRGQQNAATGP